MPPTAESDARDEPTVVGGLRWWNPFGGVGAATWPLVRLTLSAEGFDVRPTVRWLGRLIPHLHFEWADVESVQDARWGVRFTTKAAPRSLVFLTWPRLKSRFRILRDAERFGAPVLSGTRPVGWTGA